MGFRHKYTENDKVRLRASISQLAEKSNRTESEDDELEKLRKTEKEIEDESKDQVELQFLKKKLDDFKVRKNLTVEEIKEREESERRSIELRKKWPDLYQQPIKYFDHNGFEQSINVPNLSLLPIKPLAIQQANFKFELKVKDNVRSVESTIRSDTHANPRRPWFLIQDPKTIEGEFAPQQKDNSTEKTIKIDVTIGSVETPYGLSKLITSLANLTEINNSSQNQ
jgi:hypothetical protein